MFAQHGIGRNDSFEEKLARSLTKALLLDLEDGSRAEALKAFTVVRDYTGLSPKRAREAEGQLRFRMLEQSFESVCQQHGWMRLEGDLIPNSDLRVFQPFMRKEVDEQGIILALAAMPDKRTLPPANKSRKAGVTLNYDLTPRLALTERDPQPGDIFILFLVARNREKAGQIEEIAIGIVDSGYENFLFYETLDKFFGDAEEAGDKDPTESSPTEGVKVILKKRVIPFVPPEDRPDHGQEETGTE